MLFRASFRLMLLLCLLTATLRAAEKTAPTRPAWTKSRIVGAPQAPEPYRLESAFPQLRFERPTSIEQFPGANRLLVTEMGGKVFTIVKGAATKEKDLVVDLKGLLPQELAGKNVSLLDAEFHPQFGENRSLFICYVHPGNGGHTRVSRLTLTGGSTPSVVPGSEQVIITWPSGGHNAGCLEFGKDGFLYIATGDGSGPNPPDGRTTGQDVSDLLGAILRIDIDRQQGDLAYAIPADNPFVNTQTARGEVWAYGLRNPFKIGVDMESGDVFAADNGWESWEMVHRIVRGGNCGWPIMEGRALLRSEVKPGPTPIIPPVKDHPHTEANSVIGGPVYRGAKLPQLAGSFVYGDYITGTIWSVRRESDGSYSHATLCDTDQRIVSFTQGNEGELYVLDYDFTGQIYELLPSDLPDTSATFPRRLSETGLFTSLENLEPAPGVVPYSVQVERWLDGAHAQRWLAIPGDGQVQLSTSKEESPVYPEGTVLVKHLSLPEHKLRLETQLLHFERGVWRPYSYLWNEAGTDAELVDSIGTQRGLKIPSKDAKEGFVERTWRASAVNECKLCHNAESRNVLGFVPHQLTRLVASSGGETELTRLSAMKAVAKAPTNSADDQLRLVDPHDAAQPLDERARSYLHVNCSMCHQPGGNAIVSFFLRKDLPFEKLNTSKGTGIGTFGLRDAKLIVPGDPARSVLMYRMSKLGYARMPYIGSQVVDSRGVALIDAWIRSMPGEAGAGAVAQLLELTSALNGEPAARAAKIDEFVKSTGGALALVARLHGGTVKDDDRAIAVRQGSAAPTDIRGLFDTFIPESQRRPTLGANVDPQTILSKSGDVQRGKLIFYSDGARCRNCHDASDRKLSIGPTIQDINKKYTKLTDLLPHILQPSLKVDEPFAAYTALTDDGRVIGGLLVEQSDRQVVLKTAEKKLVQLPRASIEELRKSEKSLMPDNILSDLTAQEAADLLTYLASLGAAK
ncbi:Soluble aldose sugar dehydrogenase YliI precursor [Anatilimnocola aggregata]|uniref:Soluble aldose sugar dehydrogenase YliI n=1 Tax=Anatilimnocola aggregata TaxID=2528021 RepID=A0A517YAD6_9BACT|nr:PQQ-dependent sugar dehydrogenase [Anatilimnocola aggregata]QDU27161.1 Soluble aldose sugar dehydrogenase YliI precursor [Anatilimnocola aggregata]